MLTDKKLRLTNPISSDLDTLRTSIFSNILTHCKNNIDRGYKNLMLFEVGPVFSGINPGDQSVVAGALRLGHKIEKSWIEKNALANVYDVKSDAIFVLLDLGMDNFYLCL